MAKKTSENNVTDRINKRMDQVREAAKNANDFVYKTSEEILEGTIDRSAEWQGVTEKAIKGGLKLAAKQQDIVFDSLEMVKDQFNYGRKRFKSLFGMN